MRAEKSRNSVAAAKSVEDAGSTRGKKALRPLLLDVSLLAGIALGAALWAWLMWGMHEQTQRSATQVGMSLVTTVAGDIQRNLEGLSLSVDKAAETAASPGIWEAPTKIQRAALFDASVQVRRLSAILLIDRDGYVRSMSGDQPTPTIDLGDRDYFQFHRTHADPGPLITGPTVSRFHGNKLLIVSKRVNDGDGNFAGVVSGGLLLSYFDELFGEFRLGDDDAAALIDMDGQVIARVPTDIRANTTNQTSLFWHLQHADSGSYIDASPTDGRQRLVAYRKIDGLPLVVAYAQATSAVFAGWVRLATYTGLLLLALQTAKVLLILRLRNERLRRAAAERHAQHSAVALAILNDDLQDRITQAMHARQDALQQLAKSQRLEALGQLASGIAHDINNVLQTISGACCLIQDRGKTSADINRLANTALSAADRGSAVTRRLLVFARQALATTDDVDAALVLADLQELLNHTLCSSTVVELDVDDDLPPLRADRMQLETVIINLSANARDAMPNGGTITIAAKAEVVGPTESETVGLAAGDYVRLSVADRGTGMDGPTLARATEPFFSTKGVDKGTGLGVPMAKEFAQQSKGKFAISSQLGVGTIVTLWFPSGRQIKLKDPERPSPVALHRGFQSDRPRVLLVARTGQREPV
jgi:signal transduction histidine kinase